MRLLKMLAVVLSLSLTLLAAGSPFSGTWKLDPTKSTPPEPKSDIPVVDVGDNGIKFSEDVVDDKGQPLKISYEAKFDGRDYPVTGVPDTDSISYRRVNAYTLQAKLKKGGKTIGEFTVVVSKDGKITTVQYTDYSHEKPVKSTAVYDKQ